MSRPVAFVTSAASGLARGIAIDLASHGYDLALTDRPNGTSLDETVATARAAGTQATAIETYTADHAKTGETRAAIEAAYERFGRIDAYVHAVGPIVVKAFAKCTFDDAQAMLAGNYLSAVEGAFAILPIMRAQHAGRLIFFGMNGSHLTQPAKGMSLYGAAKAAVVSLARTLSLEEAGNGITVNVIEPGDIRNKTADRAAARAIPADNPTGHAGSWQDVAAAVRFLLSDDASFINGAIIGVNGGLVAAFE